MPQHAHLNAVVRWLIVCRIRHGASPQRLRLRRIPMPDAAKKRSRFTQCHFPNGRYCQRGFGPNARARKMKKRSHFEAYIELPNRPSRARPTCAAHPPEALSPSRRRARPDLQPDGPSAGTARPTAGWARRLGSFMMVTSRPGGARLRRAWPWLTGATRPEPTDPTRHSSSGLTHHSSSGRWGAHWMQATIPSPCDFRLLTCDFALLTSNFSLLTSNFCLPPSNPLLPSPSLAGPRKMCMLRTLDLTGTHPRCMFGIS